MGSTGTYREPGISSLDFFTHQFGLDREGGPTVVAHGTSPTSGDWNRAWYAAIREPDGRTWALVVLMAGSGDNFYYKDMSEDMGPYECAAPAKVLNALSPTDDTHANEWRAKCRANIERKAVKVTPGMTLRFNHELDFGRCGKHDTLTYLGTYANRRNVCRTPDGQLVRLGQDWKTRLRFTVEV